MSKKFNDCVRPGVEEVRARPRTWSKELMRLDLPTLERPRKAISGFASRGQSSSLNALLRNSALTAFIYEVSRKAAKERKGAKKFFAVFAPLREPVLVTRRGGLCSSALLIKCDQFLHAVADGCQLDFMIGTVFNNLFKVPKKVRIAHLFTQRRQKRLQLCENEEVLAVGIVEHLRVDGAVVNE